jgi:hypothetical protein
VRRQSSFSGGGRRLSESDTGRTTNTTGDRTVNMVMETFNRDISSSPIGRHGIIVANTQSQLDSMRENINKKLANAREKLSNMKNKPKTALSNINKQNEIIKGYEYRLRKHNNAIQKVKKVLGKKRGRYESSSVNTAELKRTKSTEEPLTTSSTPPTITTTPPEGAQRPTPLNFISQLKGATGKINRSRETVVETQAPPKNTQTQTKKTQTQTKNTQSTDKKTQTQTKNTQSTDKKTQTSTKKTKKSTKKTKKPPKTTTTSTQTSSPKTTTTSTQTSSPKKTPSPKPTTIQPLVTNQSVNKIVKAITERDAKVPTTPPGVTKTNLQKFLVPFKQPVSIKFAPSIRATGGTGGTGGNATIIQTKNKKNDDKKKKPIKKFNILADPASAYRKSVVASKRKEIMSKLRTPTVGQRKKHVIQLIDKELRKMKVPKDIERKIIAMYSKALSEKQIKQLFGGRSAADVKKILKKQVDYFKKKKR